MRFKLDSTLQLLYELRSTIQTWRWSVDRYSRKDRTLQWNLTCPNGFWNGMTLVCIAYFPHLNRISFFFLLISFLLFFFLSLQTLTKRKFLCTSDYDEGYFDFHCLPGGKPPSDGMEFYTACGTPFPNHVEYIVVIAGICWIAFLIFVNLHFRSGTETVYGSTTVSSKSQQSNPKKRASKKDNWNPYVK